jgi:hypothetical protein
MQIDDNNLNPAIEKLPKDESPLHRDEEPHPPSVYRRTDFYYSKSNPQGLGKWDSIAGFSFGSVASAKSEEVNDIHDMRVVVVYDTIDAAQHATQALARIHRQVGTATEFIPLGWSFDLLSEPEWRAIALEDALQADILMLATSRSGELPLSVIDWLGSAIAGKSGNSDAVVAFLGIGETGAQSPSPHSRWMQSLSQSAGLDFFSNARPELLAVCDPLPETNH